MKRALAMWLLGASMAMAQSTVTGSKTMQGSWDASGAASTKPARSGATLPPSCGAGEFFFNTAAAAGQNLYLCNPANTWSPVAPPLPAAGGDLSGSLSSATVAGIQGKPVSAAAPANGQMLTWSGSQWAPEGMGGDLSGAISAATVQAIQGQPVATTAPATGQVLTWSGSAWGAQNPTGSSGGGSVTERVLIFDGSTAIPGETMTSWTCTSGAAAACASGWTVPTNVYWVRVQIWSAGGSGVAGFPGASGEGGGGGGYWEGVCPVTPSATVTVTVGSGGLGTSSSPYSYDGGNSSFGGCATVIGGTGGNSPVVQGQGGYLAGTGRFGWLDAGGGSTVTYTGLHDPTRSWCTWAGAVGSVTTRHDGGGCGGGGSLGTAAGYAGGVSINGGGGGGSGGSNSLTGGAGGVSALANTLYPNGGNGGAGGGWTAAGGIVNCTAGNAPGGGGGSAGAETSGGATLGGCSGARGEIRVYYMH